MANTNQIALHSEKGRAQCRIMPDASFQFESLISYHILPYVISYVGNLYYTLSRTSFAHQILLENVWTFLGPVQHTTWQHSSRHGLFLTDPGMWGRSMRLSMRSKALPTNMKTYLRYTVIHGDTPREGTSLWQLFNWLCFGFGLLPQPKKVHQRLTTEKDVKKGTAGASAKTWQSTAIHEMQGQCEM